jgi:hypothetical protein
MMRCMLVLPSDSVFMRPTGNLRGIGDVAQVMRKPGATGSGRLAGPRYGR